MSFMADFDSAAHAAFADAGMGAFAGSYTAPVEDATPQVCRGYIDHGMQTVGEFGQAVTPRTQISLLRADVADPVPEAVVAAEGDSYLLDALVSRDPSMTVWLVTRV